MSGIYLHIPFCRQACTYCDFHFSTVLSARDAVIGAIVQEVDQRNSYLETKTLNSIYFGGGTPSILSPPDFQRIFSALEKYFYWDRTCEITLEANPDDIHEAALNTWKDAGINRLSIGLQSFNDEELKWMNRAHTAKESLSAVKLAQDKGFGNITIDLIYGSKFQTLPAWEKTLQKAIGLGTQHISAYNLTIENKTVLGANYKKGIEPAVNDDLSSRQFLVMMDELRKAGFRQYEISNFGKEGFFARHNSNYWLQQHYLGLGPSAHSFNGTSRQWNVRNNNLYVRALKENSSFFEREELSDKDRYNEYVLTRLRTMWGCDLGEIEILFGKEKALHFKSAAALQSEYMKKEKDIYTLNRQGKLRADGIASDLFIL